MTENAATTTLSALGPRSLRREKPVQFTEAHLNGYGMRCHCNQRDLFHNSKATKGDKNGRRAFASDRS